MEAPVWTPGKVDTSGTAPPWVPGGLEAKPESPPAYVPPSGTPTPERVAAAPLAAAAAADFLAAPVAPAPTPLRAPAPTPARKPTVARRPPSGGPTERPAWLIPAAIGVVLLLLLGTGIFILAHRGSSPSGGVATTSPSAKTSPKASPKPSPKPSPTTQGLLAVPNYGPAKADPISKVQFCTVDNPCPVFQSPSETGTTCSLTSCTVEVSIYFSAQPKGTTYSYVIKFFDRCTGVPIDLPGSGGTTLSANWISGIGNDHVHVNIPSGVKSGALVAVAQQPAVAASAPLLLGGDSCA